jgi:hypothetical protein
MHPQVQLADLSGEDVLKPHLSDHGQDILFRIPAVVACHVLPDGKVFACEPTFHVTFQGQLGGIERHAVFDLVRDLPNSVMALALGLGILGDAFSAQADLGAPALILALVDRAFVIASLFCHVHFSFL